MPTKIASLELLIEELTILIGEIESNPGISSWTIRMTLKAIVEKANKIQQEAP
ncbi:MAG TPA: hypothetical protein V6D28_16430 [Leptolyngbyaceae cyanobacterium]